MSMSTVDLDVEPVVVRGPSLPDALAAAEAALGRPVRAIKADRIRRGGIAGFFATDLGVEVTAVPVDSIARAAASVGTATVPSAPTATVAPTLRADLIDELLGSAPTSAAATGDPVDFASLDFDAPPTSFEAALDRLVSSAGLQDGPNRPPALTHTPVRDPAPRNDQFPASRPGPAATAALQPPVARSATAPTARRVEPAPTAVQFAAPSIATAPSIGASPSIAAAPIEARAVETRPSAPVAMPAAAPATPVVVPVATRTPVPARTGDDARVHAELAAVAAGDLLGRMLDRPGSGAMSVTITITGADGTKCRAEARSEGLDGPSQR